MSSQDTVDIVNFVGNYKNVDDTPAVYIMLNLYYDDPSIDHANGNLPTCAAAAVWEAIVKAFASTPHVIFSITNEPFYPSSSSVGDAFSGTDLEWSANVWEAMNTFVGVIRTAEAAAGATNPHLIAVQARRSCRASIDTVCALYRPRIRFQAGRTVRTPQHSAQPACNAGCIGMRLWSSQGAALRHLR